MIYLIFWRLYVSHVPAVFPRIQQRATCDQIKWASCRGGKLQFTFLNSKQLNRRSYLVWGVIILLNWKFDAFHADLQDAGRRRVVLHRHPSAGSNLENKCSSVRKAFYHSESVIILIISNKSIKKTIFILNGRIDVRPPHSGQFSAAFSV